MALKLVLCLLFVVGVFSQDPPTATPTPTVTQATPTPTVTQATPTPTVTQATPTPTVTQATPTPTVTGGTTEPPATGGTTEPPATGGTTVQPTTTTPSACASDPCGGGSTCHDRANETYVCLCLAGDYYDENQCIRGKAFPGNIAYNQTYADEMADTRSIEFKHVSDEIVEKLKGAFKNSAQKYRNSAVTKISPETRRNKGIIATVEINFAIDSSVTLKDIDEAVKEVGTFTEISLCKTNACNKNAKCMDGDGIFTCECLDKYISTNFSDRICVACPNNEKAVGNETCIPCDFGYTGFNCEDNWQLTLVIVGTVLGCLLLITIILLPVVALKTKKKSKKGKATEANDYAKPKPNPAPVKAAQVSNGSAVPRPTPVQAAPAGGRAGFGGNGVPRIPRATANESWDRSNLEMVPSNSRQNLIPSGRNSRRFDDDDSNLYSRPLKPQNNPYAMARPQVNPYASSQGNSNPYYRN